jgi:hypothetical protein
MIKEATNQKLGIYQIAVTVAGLSLWLVAVAYLVIDYTLRDQLIVFMLAPLTILVGMFPQRLPSLMPSFL